MSDDKNPNYIFSMTDTSLLLKIANGDLDAMALVKKELANRGIDKNGAWAGFDKAAKIWS